MSANRTATPQEARWIGALAGAAGLYFMSIGFGLLPVPGGPGNLHAPDWVLLLVGLIFFLGGVAVLMQALCGGNASGELPADTPLSLRVVHYLIGVAIFASFAMVGSWIAIGGEARQFSSNVPFVGHSTTVTIARVAFGIGAMICWLGTIGFAISGARKLRRHGKST